MTISAALAEAYAANDVSADLLFTIELNHITIEAPLRFVQGRHVKGVYESVTLPVPGDPAAVFTVVDFSCQLPGQEEGGTTQARLRVDNVSRYLHEALRAAVSADQPYDLIYREYSTKDPNHPEIYTGLRLGKVKVSALSATGDLSYEEIEMRNFPTRTYDLVTYPALYGQ